ncbi:hypothetical protein V8F20_000316 [Naviculisporaceae sp. PSN 640]
MDFHLAHEAAALGSDNQLRRRNLQNLVSSLSLYEIRDIKKLADKILDQARTDIFVRLPAELRLEVAEYVDFTDLPNFLTVSKAWREAWTQDSMINLIMPGFLAHHRLASAITPSGQNVQALFYEACQKLQHRCLGKYRSLLIEAPYYGYQGNFMIDKEYHEQNPQHSLWPIIPLLDEPRVHDLLYSHGRVAWQPNLPMDNHSSIIVDNLRSQLRKVYTIPVAVMQGGDAKLMALGDKLLVASLERTLHAWDLVTNDRCSVTLPSSNLHCKTYGKHVYIYPYELADDSGRAQELHIYTWKFNGSLRELDTTPLMNAIGPPPQQRKHDDVEPWHCTGIIPHPLDDETIFVVCQLLFSVSVHKYTRGVYSTTFSFTSAATKGVPYRLKTSRSLSRQNSYGKYAVAVWGEYRLSTVCFDTISETFSEESYRPVVEIGSEIHTTFWDSQLITYDIHPVSSSERDYKLELKMLYKGEGITRGGACVRGVWLREARGIHHVLNHPRLDMRNGLRDNYGMLVFADEDFIIIRFKTVGYMALSFQNEFRHDKP